MNLEQRCIIPVARPALWAFLTDIPRMARCVPGAGEVVATGDDQYSGRLRIKVGPIALNLQGVLLIQLLDPENHRTVARAEAKDRRLGSGANVTANITLVETGPETTELQVQAQVRFLGKLGEFGEPIIRKQSAMVIAEFARNVAAHFEGVAASGGAAPGPG
jgi:carbon monoxide dehydrogenase subunit G